MLAVLSGVLPLTSILGGPGRSFAWSLTAGPFAWKRDAVWGTLVVFSVCLFASSRLGVAR